MNKMNEHVDTDSSDYEEVVEEQFVHVTIDNQKEITSFNPNSNVRVMAVDSASPVLQIDDKIIQFKKWSHIPGTAMFFEKKKDPKTIDLLYDKRSTNDLQYVGSSQKRLEMTTKVNTLEKTKKKNTTTLKKTKKNYTTTLKKTEKDNTTTLEMAEKYCTTTLEMTEKDNTSTLEMAEKDNTTTLEVTEKDNITIVKQGE